MENILNLGFVFDNNYFSNLFTRDNPKLYRPVSPTSVMGRLLERIHRDKNTCVGNVSAF